MTWKYLVGTPESVQFLDLTLTESGTKALLGDPEPLDQIVKPDVLSSHIELRHAVKKLAGLVIDPTRTETDKHIAAKVLADKTVAKLSKTAALVRRRANDLTRESVAAADRDFAETADKGILRAEIREFLRDASTKPNGLQTIRQVLKESEDVAAVLWTSPRFLLGLPEDLHDTLRIDGLDAHRPSLSASLSNAIGLEKVAEKFEKTAKRLPLAFYNPVVASQVSKRVGQVPICV